MDLTLLLASTAAALAVLNLAILLLWRPGVGAAALAAAEHRRLAKHRETVWGWRISAEERRLKRTLELHGITELAEPEEKPEHVAEAEGFVI